MTTTSDARKRLAESEHIAHPATIPGAVSDAAVEAAKKAAHDEFQRPEHACDGTEKDCRTTCPAPAYHVREWGELLDVATDAALTAALPHLRKDWEAPFRELIADAREDKRIHDVTTARTVGSDHRPCESMARLRFAERLEALLTPEVPE